ncbi:MAG: GDP-mannose 4,6-dehydratase [Actinomycetota bacterium]
MKALVTGASGFVGQHLCAHLRQTGDDVVACDRDGPHSFDITDREAVHDAFTRHRPDVVFHLAAFTHVGKSWQRPREVLRVNVEGTANVLDAAGASDVARILYVGSAEEYGKVDGNDGPPLAETAPLRPSTPYGASKVAASFLALQAWIGSELAVVRVRPFGHTGPGQPDQFVVPGLAHRIARAEADGGEQITVGALDPVRDIGDVRDFVVAYRLAALRGEPGEVYNVCTGTGVSIAEIADKLLARAHRPLRIAQDPVLMRPVEVPRLVGDPTKLQAATGWAPRFTLDDTLTAVLDEARQSYGP